MTPAEGARRARREIRTALRRVNDLDRVADRDQRRTVHEARMSLDDAKRALGRLCDEDEES